MLDRLICRLGALVAVLVLVATACGEAEDPVAVPTEAPVELLPPGGDTEAESATTGATTAPTTVLETTQAVPTSPPIASVEAVIVESTPVDPLACLSLRARAAQLLLPLATQPELAGAVAFADDGSLGGIGLLGEPDDGLADALAQLQLASFVPIMVASDEEGGSVQRLSRLLGPIPSAAATAQSKSPDDVRKQWVEYGARVKAVGVDVVLGPVLDVGGGPGISSRSFSDDPLTVAAYGRAVVEGLLEAGVTPVLKHFPGHGRATADSHLELPTTPPLAEMQTVDLVPYRELISDPVIRNGAGVMIGHLSVPGLAETVPTSLSEETINGLLRSELGFDGIVFSDAINMGAIANSYDRLDAIERAILAGTDIVILGSLADLTPAINHLVTRVEQDPAFAAIVDNRAARVLAAKGQGAICAGAQ